jgi:hypothetical protein
MSRNHGSLRYRERPGDEYSTVRLDSTNQFCVSLWFSRSLESMVVCPLPVVVRTVDRWLSSAKGRGDYRTHTDDVACQDSRACSADALVDCYLFGFFGLSFFLPRWRILYLVLTARSGPWLNHRTHHPRARWSGCPALLKTQVWLIAASKCFFLSIFLFFFISFFNRHGVSVCVIIRMTDRHGALWTVVQQ